MRAVAVSRWVVGLALANGALVGLADQASADEHEWHVGAAFGASQLSFARAPSRWGMRGEALARYGLSDAVDLTMELGVDGYPTDDRLALSSEVGVGYVVDVSRFIPAIGVALGAVDVIDPRCDWHPTTCGHTVLPAIAVPASFEFRVADVAPVGVRFEYRLLFLGAPSSQLFVGLYGGFIP